MRNSILAQIMDGKVLIQQMEFYLLSRIANLPAVSQMLKLMAHGCTRQHLIELSTQAKEFLVQMQQFRAYNFFGMMDNHLQADLTDYTEQHND